MPKEDSYLILRMKENSTLLQSPPTLSKVLLSHYLTHQRIQTGWPKRDDNYFSGMKEVAHPNRLLSRILMYDRTQGIWLHSTIFYTPKLPSCVVVL